MIAGDAPIKPSSRGARKKNGRPSTNEAMSPEEHCLDCGDGCAVRVLLADAARDHRGRRHAEPHAHREDQGEDRLGQADRGDRVRTEAADPKDVDHCEQRFQHHLQHHGDGEQQDRPVQAARGVVLVAAPQGFSNGLPKRRRGRRSWSRFACGSYPFVFRGPLKASLDCMGDRLAALCFGYSGG